MKKREYYQYVQILKGGIKCGKFESKLLWSGL